MGMFFAGLLGVGFVPMGVSTAQAQAVRQLSALNGSDGFRLDGAAVKHYSGYSVSGAGDVNGDGFSDVIVGARGAGSFAGFSYVVFGKASGWTTPLALSALTGSDGFRIDGVGSGTYATGDQSGLDVSAAGDVNGDGFSDLLIGAPGTDTNGTSSGSTYVVFGKASGWGATLALSTLNGSTGFRLDGAAADDSSGGRISGAGDVNGDGFSDIIVGASSAAPNGFRSGSSYVVFGKASGWTATVALSGLNGTTGFRMDGLSAGAYCGVNSSGAGDVNGDGFSDIIVGAWGADPNGFHSGTTYVVFGKASGWTSNLSLSGLNGSTGFRLHGPIYSRSGISATAAGDVNGDGFSDLLVGAPNAGANYYTSGYTYVVFGKASGWSADTQLSALTVADGIRLDGADSDQAGFSASGAGDVNGDGFSDLLIGAPYDHGTQRGSSYVVFGKASGWSANQPLSGLDGSTGFRLEGAADGNFSGWCVSGAGDVNGDSFADVIIGANGAAPNGAGSGSSYVVFGTGMADGGGTYRGATAAGNAPKASVGTVGNATDAVPASRVRLDFDAGAASAETVVLTRSKAGITNLEPAADVANVVWQIATTRIGFANAAVTLKYTDAEIAGIGGGEAGLSVFKAPALSGPWTKLTTTVNAARNEASATVTGFSYFALAASTVPVAMSGWELE